MRKVIVLSGVSGCGKSTYIEALRKEMQVSEGMCQVVSADHFFMKEEHTCGCDDPECDSITYRYAFDPSKLSQAHGACFLSYIEALRRNKEELVVVDNTNTTSEEIAPYILGAQAYGWDVEVVTLMCESEDDVKVCAARNSHGVPFGGVMAQHRRLCERRLPPWWKNKTVRPTF